MWADLLIPIVGVALGAIGLGVAGIQAKLARIQVNQADEQKKIAEKQADERVMLARKQAESAQASMLAAQRTAAAAEEQLELLRRQRAELDRQAAVEAENQRAATRKRQQQVAVARELRRQAAAALAERAEKSLADMRLFLAAIKGGIEWEIQRGKQEVEVSYRNLRTTSRDTAIAQDGSPLAVARASFLNEAYHAQHTLLFLKEKVGSGASLGPTGELENRFELMERKIKLLRQA